jgi:hypothetical protein
MMSTAFLCTVVDWLEKRQAPCFYKAVLNIECPGCGMQRAFIALLKGDLLDSIRLYPALLPTMAMLLFLLLHISLKIKNGSRILLYLFVFNSVVIVVNYLYKFFNL